MKSVIGTVCDNYKLEKFLEAFKKAGIEVMSVTDLMAGTKLIKVFADQRNVKPIVDEVTQYFYDRNSGKLN